MHERLRRGIEQLGLARHPSDTERLSGLIDEVDRWNRHTNLVKASRAELVVKHVLDSLAAVKELQKINKRARIADVGSGAGFPGIPLAVFMPESRFTLIERSTRRADFLRNVTALMKLENVVVWPRDIGELNETFDVVVSRAYAGLADDRMRRVEKITRRGGTIAAYKGRLDRIRRELEPVRNRYASVDVIPLHVPFLEQERHLVLLRMQCD